MASNSFPPPPYTHTPGNTNEHEAALLADTTAWIPGATTSQLPRVGRLEKPIVIPRVDTLGSLSSPLLFVRAYSPNLRQCGIGETEFMEFVDNLAVCQAAPVPLQALNTAGTIVGFVPDPIAMAVSTGISVGAGVGTVAITTVRTRRFMEKVNREFFGPRGLKASICKNDELVTRLRCDPMQPELAPLGASVSIPASLKDRRMSMLAPYIAPLSYNVPQPSPQRNKIDQMSARAIERRVAKKHKKEQKKANKMMRKESERQRSEGMSNLGPGQGTDTSSDSSSESEDVDEYVQRKVEKINRKADRDLATKGTEKAAKIEENRRKDVDRVIRVAEEKRRKGEKRIQKGDSKAMKKQGKNSAKEAKGEIKSEKKQNEKVTKMEFLVIENLA